MANLLAELKRRHIYRVAAAYAVVAWVLIQLVNNVAPALRLPEWAPAFVIVLLLVGFPIMLVFAWVHQLVPESGALARVTTVKLDWALIGALIVVIALVSYEQLAPSVEARKAQEQQGGVAAARAASAAQVGAISIAVLPFANMSGDAGQEFFSDGITEEITSALAKVPDLRVVGRTSAFQFKGQNQDLRAIGQSLNATHLIEGSVRKAGERVRITVQLIKADDGTHIWAEDYDRQLTDIFAIQEDIARAITTSLRMPLGLKPGENLVNNRNIDPESYQQYLRARALIDARRVTEAAALLEQIVVRYPNYAPAWAVLASAYDLTPNRSPARNGTAEEFRRVVDAYFPKAEAAAQRAIQLDPNLAAGYERLSALRYQRGKPLEAEEFYLKASALDPGSAFTHGRAIQLAALGRLKDALAMREQLQSVEPFVPLYNGALTEALWLNGRNDDAIAMAKTLPPGAPGSIGLAMIYASMGRYAEAADSLMKIPLGAGAPAGIVEEAVRLLRTAPAKTDIPQKLPALGTFFAWVYLSVGAESRVLDNYETLLEGGRLPGGEMGSLWHPFYAPVRKTDRFKVFVRKAGFVDYWRAKGWPEFCHATTGDDFACE